LTAFACLGDRRTNLGSVVVAEERLVRCGQALPAARIAVENSTPRFEEPK
jgi:hypothetical protein